jgi:uncharacterized membrane protein YfcA
MHLDVLQWTWLAVAALIIGVSKTGIPGLGILAVSLAALVIGAKNSTGLILPMLIAGDVCAVAYYRHHASWKYILRLAPWAVAGILLGTFALGRLADAQIRPLMGGIVLALVIGNFWLTYRPGVRERLQESHALAAAVGILAGFTTMVSNAAGPIMIIYLLAMGLPKNVFLGTSAWYFFLLNCFKVPFSAWLGLINRETLLLNAALLPAILLGAWLGVKFAKRLPEKAFAIVAQLLAAAAAVKLLIW